jgi:2-hydroxy-4-carboxymuconate semialdehyde hemiacetal dehydrogenase
MGDPLRLAIIGRRGSDAGGPPAGAQAHQGLEVLAPRRSRPSQGPALADRFGIPDAFDGIEQVLDYESLDALVICSPTHLHEGHILAALAANLHVFCERPSP